MQIYTLWQHDGSDSVPWIVAAVDEFTIEENRGYPEGYANLKDGNPALRELVIEVPVAAVRGLFVAPTVKGTPQEDK